MTEKDIIQEQALSAITDARLVLSKLQCASLDDYRKAGMIEGYLFALQTYILHLSSPGKGGRDYDRTTSRGEEDCRPCGDACSHNKKEGCGAGECPADGRAAAKASE